MDKDNIRNVSKAGNSRGITIPSYYWKYMDGIGKSIKAFSYEIGEDNKLILTPIFEVKNGKKAKKR